MHLPVFQSVRFGNRHERGRFFYFLFLMAGQIHRHKKEAGFVLVDKTPLNDPTLSWKAKGLLTYLLSLPDDWKINISDLKKRSSDGRDSTVSGIDELIQARYVFRKQDKGDDGKFLGYEYHVFERPEYEIEYEISMAEGGEKQGNCTVNGFSGCGFPENGNAENGKTVFGKPATTNNQIDQELILLKNENTDISASADATKFLITTFEKMNVKFIDSSSGEEAKPQSRKKLDSFNSGGAARRQRAATGGGSTSPELAVEDRPKPKDRFPSKEAMTKYDEAMKEADPQFQRCSWEAIDAGRLKKIWGRVVKATDIFRQDNQKPEANEQDYMNAYCHFLKKGIAFFKKCADSSDGESRISLNSLYNNFQKIVNDGRTTSNPKSILTPSQQRAAAGAALALQLQSERLAARDNQRQRVQH